MKLKEDHFMARGKTLAEQTADEIKLIIQENSYGAGKKLPTEKELTDLLGVGRNTLREALRILQSRNIVTIRQGSGTYVSEKFGVPDDPFGFEMLPDHDKVRKDILEILTIMEPEAAALAAEHRTKNDVDRLEEVLEIMSAKIEKDEECLDEECRFYEIIAEATQNIVIERMTPLMTRGIRYFASTLTPTDFKYGVRNYYSVLEGIRRRRSSEAKTAMAYHVLFLDHQYKMLIRHKF